MAGFGCIPYSLFMRMNMKHTTLTRKSILAAAACFCFATVLTAQTAERIQQDTASSVKTVSASMVTPATPPAKWNAVRPIPGQASVDKSWFRVEPGVLSYASRMDLSVAPPTQRYGAAPAVVNLNFGRK
jgi:hypothetical protein